MLRQNGPDRSKRSDKTRNNYGHGSKRHFCLLESPISKPPNGLCPSKSSLPGTEFLDAETGGQKSALETADVHRDGKSGDDTGEIPAETASLEADEMRVWEDWMVVCAVKYELVSDTDSLLTGKLTGYFAFFGHLEAVSH